jgi:uracil-DNA glycosylase
MVSNFMVSFLMALPTSLDMQQHPSHPRFHVVLDSPDDAQGVTQALQYLVQLGIAPEAVTWAVGTSPENQPSPGSQDDLFAQQATCLTVADIQAHLAPSTALPWQAGFDALLRSVVMHSEPSRFAQLHRYAMRLAAKPALWRDTLDIDRLSLNLMSRQVSRDIHKMHAFVRFRPVSSAGEPEQDTLRTPRHVAWFEPDHHILRAAAPFFAKRFAAMHWAIFTPRGSVQWNRRELIHGPALEAHQAPPPDAGDALWLTYYRHTFNPARVKVDMMKREMPVRYWKHLPEASAIAPMLAEAPARVGQMYAHTEHQRKRDT